MTKRDAINEILLSLNELPLEDSDSIEDVSIAIIIDKQLDITKRKILSQGWFFNTVNITISPDEESGYIIIPPEYLSVVGDDGFENIAVRDNKLFNKEDLTFYFDDEEIDCIVIQDLNFDDIPYVVVNYIVQVASLACHINILGASNNDLSIRREEIALSRIEALRENARNIDGNVLSSDIVTDLMDRTSI